MPLKSLVFWNLFKVPSFGVDFGTANSLAYFHGRGIYPRIPIKNQIAEQEASSKQIATKDAPQDTDDTHKVNEQEASNEKPAKTPKDPPLATMHPPMRSVGLRKVGSTGLADGDILIVGELAYDMTGREPKHLQVVRAIEDGRVQDTAVMMHVFDTIFEQACPKAKHSSRVIQPDLIIVPVSGNTMPMHRQMMKEAMMDRFLELTEEVRRVTKISEVYAGRVVMVSQAAMALLGAGLDLEMIGARLVIDIGGGTTNIAILLASGEVVFHCSIPMGGDLMDKMVQAHVKEVHKLDIGVLDAERVKQQLGRALPPKGSSVIGDIDGKSTETGQPMTVSISDLEIYQCLQPFFVELAQKIRHELASSGKPQILSDIKKNRGILTGGGSLIKGADKFLAAAIDLKISRVANPLHSVVLGTKFLLEHPEMVDKFDLDKHPTYFVGEEKTWTPPEVSKVIKQDNTIPQAAEQSPVISEISTVPVSTKTH